jgi:hypothetical protein
VRRRVLIVGATGQFGARLARRIAPWPDVELVLAARARDRLDALAAELGTGEVAVLDRRDLTALKRLNAWAVIDCAGPFQGQSYDAPKAILEAGAHYVDLADARDFVVGFPKALAALAVQRGLVAVSGASSTPALSCAVVDQLTARWTRIDRVWAAISPAGRTRVGPSVVKAILSWAGQPVSIFTGGEWKTRPGWGGARRVPMPHIGRRWLSLAETPDLDLFVDRYRPKDEAMFAAGVESAFSHLSLSLLSVLVRWRFLPSLAAFAGPLHWASERAASFGSTTGGMLVRAEGIDAAGAPAKAEWALWAYDNFGPYVPTLAAAATLRALLDGKIAAGAQTASGLVPLDDILAQASGLPIYWTPAKRAPASAAAEVA